MEDTLGLALGVVEGADDTGDGVTGERDVGLGLGLAEGLDDGEELVGFELVGDTEIGLAEVGDTVGLADGLEVGLGVTGALVTFIERKNDENIRCYLYVMLAMYLPVQEWLVLLSERGWVIWL